MSSESEVAYQGPMRALGVLMIVFGIIEIGVGGIVYSQMEYVTWDYPPDPAVPAGFGIGKITFNLEPANETATEAVGGWWGAVLVVLTGVLALISNARCTVHIARAVSLIAICVLALALVVDTYKERNNFIYCLDVENLANMIPSDDPAGDDPAGDDTPPLDLEFSCICIDNKWKIYSYNTHWGLECNDVTTAWNDKLTTSVVFLFLCSFCILCFHALTWMSLSEDASTGGASEAKPERAERVPSANRESGGTEMTPTAPAAVVTGGDHNYTKV